MSANTISDTTKSNTLGCWTTDYMQTGVGHCVIAPGGCVQVTITVHPKCTNFARTWQPVAVPCPLSLSLSLSVVIVLLVGDFVSSSSVAQMAPKMATFIAITGLQ